MHSALQPYVDGAGWLAGGRCACWLAGGRYTRCLPGERCPVRGLGAVRSPASTARYRTGRRRKEARVAGLIEDYALIGDMQTAALVGLNGCVEWLCLPRFDSPACFAALLGDEHNGHWLIAPVASQVPAVRGGSVSRRYQGDTLVLETEWTTASGVVKVIDFMPPRGGEQPVLVRIVRGVSGTVEMETVLRLRFGYGKIVPWVRKDK